MSLHADTREFLKFLRANPGVRAQIAARPGATLLYAGSFFRPMWREIESLRMQYPQAASKETLPDVIGRIHTPGQPHPTLLAWAKALDALPPWSDNGFIAWRALSGIFASNAVGAVSFCIGSGVNPGEKVFAATELPVLMRNGNVDALTKDVLGYFENCLRTRTFDMNLGLIRD